VLALRVHGSLSTAVRPAASINMDGLGYEAARAFWRDGASGYEKDGKPGAGFAMNADGLYHAGYGAAAGGNAAPGYDRTAGAPATAASARPPRWPAAASTATRPWTPVPGRGRRGKGRLNNRRQQLHGRRCRRRGRRHHLLAADTDRFSGTLSADGVTNGACGSIRIEGNTVTTLARCTAPTEPADGYGLGRVASQEQLLGHPHQQPGLQTYSLGTYLTATPTFTSTPS